VPISILFDTDPGIDDTMALLFALCSPELDVIGLTCVFGNAFVDTTTRNALRVLELAGRDDIPVARGAAQPLARTYTDPPTFVHGHDGLGDAGLTSEPRRKPLDIPAAQFIVETVMARPSEITLVPVGPLTNIALALKLEPRIAQAVKQVVIMGGTMTAPGNTSPVSEANIYNDPEAASLVFGAGWPMVMVGLDVTTKVVMSAEYLRELASAGNRYTDIIARIVPLYQQFHDMRYQMKGDIHTHDPSAIAYCLAPTLFKTVRHRVRIETQGYASGQVIADRLNRFYDGPEIDLCVDVDAPRLLALYKQRLTRAN
jgi:inosine-uridine nucleoside N-ribohydrolase